MTVPHRDREVFPHVEEDIGEDPARFLDREILVQPSIRRHKRTDHGPSYVPDTATSDPLEFIRDRIQGIDRFEVLHAWGQVERQLVRTPDGSHNESGREKIIELLQQRARELEAEGGREEQLQHRREIVVDDVQDDEDEETVWRHEPCGSTDVEQESSMAWFCHDCEQRTNRVEAVESQAVAA